MKRSIWMILLLLMPWLVTGCGKETTTHKELKHEVKQESKKADTLDIKGLTMESIQKEGKMQEVTPGTVQITSERQQLIGVKIGTVEMKPLEKVIRTVGRVDYDERKVVIVSPKIGGWIEDLYVDFTGRFVRQGEPLLTIYSPELVSTQEEYLIALRARKDLVKSPFAEVAASGT
ncbi:MAG: efflux RND transporter periplasmic adaptor subunit, partial [Deltaproteobacteria bacterium]|nr:efflux RND transporter periplasmic adaptor subunit [Deltaproteobacteria bacterium]